jgi:hypothetical protein
VEVYLQHILRVIEKLLIRTYKAKRDRGKGSERKLEKTA